MGKQTQILVSPNMAASSFVLQCARMFVCTSFGTTYDPRSTLLQTPGTAAKCHHGTSAQARVLAAESWIAQKAAGLAQASAKRWGLFPALISTAVQSFSRDSAFNCL